MNNVPLCQNEPPDIFIVIITHGLTIIDHYLTFKHIWAQQGLTVWGHTVTEV